MNHHKDTNHYPSPFRRRSIYRRSPNAAESMKEKVPMIVMKLEEALYKRAPSLEAYADLSTVESRLEELARLVQEYASATRCSKQDK